MLDLKITMHGNPLTVKGQGVTVGDIAPDFILTDNTMQPVSLKDFKGKVVILSAVPSLDTATCSIETRRFNQEAPKLGDNVVILTVSKDLPFAQARWCAAQGVQRVITLSDYKASTFAANYGLFIDGLELLTRAIFIIDGTGTVKYIQYVQEVSDEPDYQSVLEAVKNIM